MPSATTSTADYPDSGLDTLQHPDAEVPDIGCFHCGTPVRGPVFTSQNKSFCCRCCLTVFELITENGLADFYRFGKAAGVRAKSMPKVEEFNYLDDPVLRQRLVDFADERVTRVTFRVPAVHCIACVWLLENLFQLNPGIGYTRVNFPRKEVFITFENARVKLGEVVALLTSLGYGPQLNFSDLQDGPRNPVSRRLWLQLGVAGITALRIGLHRVRGRRHCRKRPWWNRNHAGVWTGNRADAVVDRPCREGVPLGQSAGSEKSGFGLRDPRRSPADCARAIPWHPLPESSLL